MRFGQSDRKIVPVMTIKSAQYDVMQEYIDILSQQRCFSELMSSFNIFLSTAYLREGFVAMIIHSSV